MKKAFCLLTVIVLVFSLFAFNASAEEAAYCGRTNASVAIRREPSSSGSRVTTVYSNKDVVIFGEHGDYYKVMYNESKFGYALKSSIDVVYTGKVTVEKTAINVRRQADVDATVLGIIPKNYEITCIGELLPGNWRKVEGNAYDKDSYDKDNDVYYGAQKFVSGYSKAINDEDGYQYITVLGKKAYTGSKTFPEYLEVEESEDVSDNNGESVGSGTSENISQTDDSSYYDYDYDYDNSEFDVTDILWERRTDSTRVWAWVSVVVIGIYAIITIFRIKSA